MPVIVTVAPIVYWRMALRPTTGGVHVVQTYRNRGPSGITAAEPVWLIGDDGAAGLIIGNCVAINFHSIDWSRSDARVVTCLWT